MTIPPGWREIIPTARAAADDGFEEDDVPGVVEATGLDVRGRLVLRISSSRPERARGIAAAAQTLSGEICDRCSRPGDPVRLAGTAIRTTRCGRCRASADEVLRRPAWRRERDVAREAVDPDAPWKSHRSCYVVEEVLSDKELAALMEGREPPIIEIPDERPGYMAPGWPITAQCPRNGPYWTIDDLGWNALLRTAFTLLLPLQCDGQDQPVRIVNVSAFKRQLCIYGRGFDDYRQGIVRFLRLYSASTCITCGSQGATRRAIGGRGRECRDC